MKSGAPSLVPPAPAGGPPPESVFRLNFKFLRSTRLACVALAGGLSGCLIPAPVEEQPAPENFAPACDPNGFEPRTDEIREHDPRVDGPAITFQALTCDDPNDDDRLFWRWFIDYNPLTGFIADRGEIPPDQRGDPLALSFDPCGLPRSGGVVLHRVDLLLADRPFLSAPEDAQQAERRNQLLPGEAGLDQATWFLRLDDRLCP